MWLKSKSSLNRERKKLVQTTVHRAACLLHSIYCGGLWYCWLALLPCESLPEDPKRKAHRKFESEEEARWRSNHHRKEGAGSFPLLSLTGGLGVCSSVAACLLASPYGSILLCVFLVVVVCLVLVCCSCNLARPFKIIILAPYHSSLTQEPFPFAFCSESNRISRTWDQKIHLHS